MNLRKQLIGILFCCIFPSTVFSQFSSAQIKTFSTDVINGKFHIEYQLQQAIPAELKTQLSFHITNIDQLSSKERPIDPTTSNSNLIAFDIPLEEFKQANKLVFFVLIKDASRTLYSSPITELNVSFLEDLKAARQRVDSLTEELAREKKKTEEQNNVITEFSAKTQPSAVFWRATPFVTDEKIVVKFELNHPGKLQTTATCQGFRPKIDLSQTVSKFQVVTVPGLKENTTCTIEAEILSITTEKPTGVKIGSEEPQLKITTPPQKGGLNLSPQFTAGADSVSIKLSANQPGFVEINYAEVINPATSDFGETKVRGARLSADEYGAPIGESIKAGDNAFTIDGLRPGKNYLITIKAKDLFGKDMISKILPTPISTLPSLPVLAFTTDPLKIDITPLQIKVTWKSNVQADKAAFEVFFGDPTKEPFVTQPATVEGTSITAILPVDQLSSVIQASKDKKRCLF